jgi:3-hydroxyisobutyrate dehydrogenase-like beta-hydroxyacid dehydrogenase
MATNADPPVPSTAAPDLSMAVGFAGIGTMGFQIASRLIGGGVPLVVWDRTQDKTEPLVARGARWVKTPKDLARSIGMGVTFLTVTDGAAVKKILFGVSGFAKGAPAGALVVNASTIDPDESRGFASRLQEKGVHYVDASIAGGVDRVQHGEAVFFVGGDDADVARARPLLEKIGHIVEHMGGTGSGNSMKLVNNVLLAGISAGTAEALALADGLGLDRAQVIRTLMEGGGRSLPLERKGSDYLARKYPAQLKTSLARKDLKLAERVALRERRPLKMTREARKLLDETILLGHGEDDVSSVFEAALARAPKPIPSAEPATRSETLPETPTPGDPPT